MPVPSLTDLFAPKTRDDIVATILQVASDVGLPVTAWQAQSVLREFIYVTAQVQSSSSEDGALAAAGGLLDYAASDWLTFTASEIYGVTRTPATFATTTITLSNRSGVSQTFQPGDIRALKQSNGITYTSETGGFIAAGSPTVPSTLDITVIADQSGSGSNANTGEINALVNPIQGISVSNANPAFGVDEQSDTSLVALCRSSMARPSINGPKDAYTYYALTALRADGVTPVGITQAVTSQGNGFVTVYLCSASGVADPDDVTACNLAVQSNCVPTGFVASVVSAVPLTVQVQAQLYLRSGSTYSTDNAQQASINALSKYFETIPIGGYSIGGGGTLFVDALIGQLYASIPGDVVQVIVTFPATDLSVNANNVLVLTSTKTDFMITRVS
jgi:hypothetical protein